MFDEIRSQYFPAIVAPGITAKSVEIQTIREVWDTISGQVFSSLAELGNYQIPEERRHHSERLNQIHQTAHKEYVIFYNAQNEPIGWSFGVMIDPSTFFMSWTGILVEYQRRGIYTAFLKLFLPYLHALGYERVTSNHMLNNRPVIIAKLKTGFYIEGIVLDERFGAQVALVYLFHEDRRQGFARAFSLETYHDEGMLV